ncbi:MAG: hypothetical protein N3B16_05095 [Candidatus Aminicenantes bacterium]|nr:hypothetical protein [Candidatus Aminicenantes bacterium]
MKKSVILILLLIWFFGGVGSFLCLWADEFSFCYQVYEKCREEAMNQSKGWLTMALALQQCDLLFSQCIVIEVYLNWIIRFSPFI